jgi:hypothetical protein
MEEKKESNQIGSRHTFFYDNENKTIRLTIDGKHFYLNGHFHQISEQPEQLLYV